MNGQTAQLRARPVSSDRALAIWSSHFNGRARGPIKALQEKKNSAVYRLSGAGPDGQSVVAKWARIAPCEIERTVYEEVLPQLAIQSPGYFGSAADETEGYQWLFVEEASGIEFDSSIPSHRAAAARWLAELHSRSYVFAGASQRDRALPAVGPAHSIAAIHAAMSRITSHIQNPALDDADRAVLGQVLDQCRLLIDRCDGLAECCERFPRTLVHGDFVGKNFRVQGDGVGARLVVFDWEMAGYGPSAADVAECEDLPAYHGALDGALRALSWSDVQALSLIGKALRWAAAVDWASWGLEGSHIRKPMRNFRCYRDDMCQLAETMRQAGLL